MAIYATIQELKNAIHDTIYENNAGLVTADVLQDRMIDIIDTLEALGFGEQGPPGERGPTGVPGATGESGPTPLDDILDWDEEGTCYKPYPENASIKTNGALYNWYAAKGIV
jgi:hypothetical protein